MTVTRLPDFLIVGATKGGTTSLHRWLRGHPDVWMPARKELRYFTVQHNFPRGPDWYADQFRDAPPATVVGEASNAYTRHPVYDGVPERIAALLPGVKLVYLIREPMRRIESHYRHRLVTGIEWRAPEAAIEADPRYLAASLYGHQIAQYRRYFSADRMLVLQSEALFAAPHAALDRLARFLGIEAARGPAFAPENVTADRRVAPRPVRRLASYPPAKDTAKSLARRIARSPAGRFLATADGPEFTLGPELRARLAERLAADRRLIADLAGPEVAHWPTPAPEALSA